MPDDIQTQQQPRVAPENNDGSVLHAALAMPDFDDGMDDPSPAATAQSRQPRNALGQYVGKVVPMAQQQQKRQPVQPQAPAPAGEAGLLAEGAAEGEGEGDADATSDVSEEWFELPPAKEGEKPTRIKAEEVWQGYQERERLKAELAQAKKQAPPVAFDTAIYETVQQRGQLMNLMRTYASMLDAGEPDLNLINPDHPNYNPDAYHRARNMQQHMQRRLAEVQQHYQDLEREQFQQQEAILRARQARERGKLLELWPEIEKPEVARQVRDDGARYYGLDDAVFSDVLDARFYAVLRDALAYRQQAQQRQTAAKVVRSKPKLVRGQAREGSPQQAKLATASQRLAETHSVEDAAEAIGALLNMR